MEKKMNEEKRVKFTAICHNIAKIIDTQILKQLDQNGKEKTKL